MKGFDRPDPMFSLCGLNCGLCPIHNMAGGCPGCGGGPGNQSCKLAQCSLEHGGVEFCFQCADYPCDKLRAKLETETLLPSRNMLRDLDRAKEQGIETYRALLEKKIAMLQELLASYNDGRRKSFYCLAVNLLELEEVNVVMVRLRAEGERKDLSLKERAQQAVALFQAAADQRGVVLKLHKKK